MRESSATGVLEGREARALRHALVATGAIGATFRQLASVLELSVPRVQETLERWEHRGAVARLGRGLWVLRDYTDLGAREDFVEPSVFDERFARENDVSIGTYHGPITFRPNEALPVHRWWPYVQGYSAEFVRGVLEDGEYGRGARVLDPFAGSGTSLVEARRSGAKAMGVELLAPAVLAAQVKTRFELDPRALEEGAGRLVRAAARVRAAPLPFLRETRRQFSAPNLNELLRLRRALPPDGSGVGEALRLAFDRILIPSSRLHRSPCLGYRRSPGEPGPPPTERFRAAVATMAEDLRSLRGESARWGEPAEVISADARSVALPGGSVDLVVTSPPYVNGMDYVMNYKVDLAWLGYALSYADLRRLRGAEVACDNLPRREAAPYASTTDTPDPWLPEILRQIDANVRRKGTYRRDDMHAIVHRYFADLSTVLRRVHDALRPGGRLVLVVGDSLLAGTYVPGDLLLARIGAALGLEIVSVEVARPRRSGQRRSFTLRESVLTLRKPRSA